MMVETILECSQDFGVVSCAGGMTNGVPGGALPQWKRELLQRRAARRPPPAPPAPPPPPPPPAPPALPAAPAAPAPRDLDEEELRYGPGIVKRLKTRYLSLALRDAPRRRPSVLRRAASLEHLLDDRLHHEDHHRLHDDAVPEPVIEACDAAPAPPQEPAPAAAPRATARPPRPALLTTSLPAPPSAPPARRDLVKRARSVDALSRLEARDDPPAPRVPTAPPLPRSARPPRRPAPLLRDTERPPPDVVRAALRKFEPRRVPAAAAPRVAAVLRGLDAARTSTPEPRARSPLSPESPGSPGPPADLSAIAEPGPPPSPARSPPPVAAPAAAARTVSRQALEGIARAGCSTRYSFEAARRGSHLPPLAAANPVLVGRARRVGVIRPMPAPPMERALPAPMLPSEELAEKFIEEPPPTLADDPRVPETSPPPPPPPPAPAEPASPARTVSPARTEKRCSPPSAMVEPTPRVAPSAPPPAAPRSPPPEALVKTDVMKPEPSARPLVNGHVDGARLADVRSKLARVAAAHAERGCNGVADRGAAESDLKESVERGPFPAAGRAARRAGRPPPPATSVVFNFSSRKEVPDYVENDGLILRASRRDRIKAGEPGVVVLRPELVPRDSDSEGEAEPDGRAPSPCAVRFVNDNVLINGRSSMPTRPDRTRIAKLKLQFDDSLTRTFEYPSETSLCEDTPAAVAAPAAPASDTDSQLAEPAHLAPLASNTHMASATLSRYTPIKTLAGAFQLGVARRSPSPPAAATSPAQPAAAPAPAPAPGDMHQGSTECPMEAEPGDARPCGADVARSWSETRAVTTDLLF